jgi:ADP-heptose:LPS heptosyltransferase
VKPADSRRRVAVFRTGYLGDTVCAVPAFRLIRQNFPNAVITFVTERATATKAFSGDVVDGLDIFDTVETYAPGSLLGAAWSLGKVVRRCQPDLLIVLPQRVENEQKLRLKRRMLGWMAGCEVWAKPFDVVVNGGHLSEPHRMVAMLKSFGLQGEKPAYAFPFRPEARKSVSKKLSHIGIDLDGSFIAFCGGGKSSVQQWSLDSYARVFEEVARIFDVPIVALGNNAEQARYKSISVIPNFHVLNDLLSLPEMIELLRSSACYVGNDTGPMHVSSAVNTPVAVIMSARDQRGCWYPDVEPQLVIRRDVPCQGCLLRECIEKKHVCMTGITPEAVNAQLIRFLRPLLAKL